MSYLLDTNTCIEILRGKNSAVLARYAGHARADLAVSAVVRSELIVGALLSVKRDENRRLAEAFCALFPCLPFDAQGMPSRCTAILQCMTGAERISRGQAHNKPHMFHYLHCILPNSLTSISTNQRHKI